jgi:hypothetical protein
MTLSPKEKAKELVHSYLTASFGTIEEYVPVPYVFAKQCALIAVDEIIEYITSSSDIMISVNALEYWQQVKNEIQLL